MIFNFRFRATDSEQVHNNSLMQYLQQQNPEILARIAQNASPEIKDIIQHNVQGLVGLLPDDDFDVQITTDRENLGNLLASAMMTGYFLHQMEHRMNLDASLSNSSNLD
jgi:putative heme iron utilization protein